MKAYIIQTDRKVAPFGRSTAKIYSPFVNFGNLLKEELSLCGLKVRNIRFANEIDTAEPSLLVPDYVFVTAPLVKKFLFLCKNNPGRIQRLSVARSKLTDYYTPLMDIGESESDGEARLLFDIFYIPAGQDFAGADNEGNLIEKMRRDSSATKVTQTFGIKIERLSNVSGKPYFEEFPVTDEIAGHIRFWFHSLLMNVLYLGLFRRRLMEGDYSFGFLNRKKNLNSGNVYQSVIGSNVWIHPTSVVENSVIADNVRIGAKTIIRDSVIMRDCTIGDSNIIKNSLFGESVTSLSNSRFRCSVISPRSTVSNLGFCYSVLGEGSFLTTAVIFLYEGISSTIKIKYNGEELDTRRFFLGSAAGEGAVLGTRAIVSPGLAIPSDTVIVLRPEEGVMKIPELSESDYYVWDNATMRKFDEIFGNLDKNDFL